VAGTKRLIYLVAHVDKTDANLLKVLSVMVNGALDEPINFTTLSEGAIDNASGVAVVLETARALANSRRTHTLRVLLTGSEESGLRGARAHVARIPNEEWPLIDAVLAGGDHAVFDHTSFFHDFGRGLFFNVTGAVLPQRSWFTGFHHAPVVAFFSCHLLDVGDWIATVVDLPVAQVHGPRDNASALDPERLGEAFLIVRGLAAELAGTSASGTDLAAQPKRRGDGEVMPRPVHRPVMAAANRTRVSDSRSSMERCDLPTLLMKLSQASRHLLANECGVRPDPGTLSPCMR
jgi:Peptidase family M28